MINNNDIPQITPTFRLQWEEKQNSYVVLYPEGVVKLSGSAGEIMKCIDGETSVNNIIKTLEEKFKHDKLYHDVIKFLEAAQTNGWIKTKS